MEIRDSLSRYTEDITCDGEMLFELGKGHEIWSQTDLDSDPSSSIFYICDVGELFNLAVLL